MKYVKKPIVVEAFQWTGDNAPGEFPDWFRAAVIINKVVFVKSNFTGRSICMNIQTLEGTMLAIPGDYLIQGVKGEIYPCRKDIFELTYELVQ